MKKTCLILVVLITVFTLVFAGCKDIIKKYTSICLSTISENVPGKLNHQLLIIRADVFLM